MPTRQNASGVEAGEGNKGAAGVDGLDIEQTAQVSSLLERHPALMAAPYRPQPGTDHDSSRRQPARAGYPTVLDRLIQQALLQVLQPDRPHIQRTQPRVSSGQTGTRCGQGRAGLRAVGQARGGGRGLIKFFDRVNHDILIDRLQRRIEDAGVIRLIRAYLNAGIMDGGGG